MKLSLLALIAFLPVSVFANEDVQPQARYNCFYQDSAMGYRHGAIGFTLSTAKGRARLDCQDYLHKNDMNGRCSFVGCRTINSVDVTE